MTDNPCAIGETVEMYKYDLSYKHIFLSLH